MTSPIPSSRRPATSAAKRETDAAPGAVVRTRVARPPSLLDAVQARGVVQGDELDLLLATASGGKRFEQWMTTLLRALKRVAVHAASPLASDPAATPDGGDFSYLLRGEARNGALATYLREVAAAPRMEREDEVRLAKRLEFVRRRFFDAILGAGVAPKAARRLLDESRLRALLDGDSSADDAWAELPNGAARDDVRRAAREYEAVRREFVERNLHVVVAAAAAYRTYGVPLLDLVQEGNAGLIRAVEKFDWRKNVRFRTYATFWIRQAVERAIAASKGIVRVPNYLQQKLRRLRREGTIPRRNEETSLAVLARAFELPPRVVHRLLETERATRSLDAPLAGDGEETLAATIADQSVVDDLHAFEREMMESRVHEALDHLNASERTILEYRYGIGRAAPMTLEEVGRIMNVSRERVRQLQVRALRKLQAPNVMARLAGFV
jgi:RNA polymerase sigma factor (sigma-70 family)